MNFSYDSYIELLKLLKKQEYIFCTYDNYKNVDKCVIMRHDVDYDLSKAVELAKLEKKHGITTTYFVLLSSDFYNPASKSSYEALHQIVNLGHNIGLHFDETIYDYSMHDMKYYILKEARILSEISGIDINCFSLHRPNAVTLETEYVIPNFVNSYSEELFREFKYISDSRRRWREPVIDIIKSEKYKKLHILTHAFWYEEKEKDMKTTILQFVDRAREDRLKCIDDNITDLKSILE